MEELNRNASEAGPETGAAEERKRTFARRALIQAGWALPAAAMIVMPRTVGAASRPPHGDSGAPGTVTVPGHTDNSVDTHQDGALPPGHGDLAIGHFDGIPGHTDGPHNDFITGGGGHNDQPFGP